MKIDWKASAADTVLAVVILGVFWMIGSFVDHFTIGNDTLLVLAGVVSLLAVAIRWLIQEGCMPALPAIMLLFSVYILAKSSVDLPIFAVFMLNVLLDIGCIVDFFIPDKNIKPGKLETA